MDTQEAWRKDTRRSMEPKKHCSSFTRRDTHSQSWKPKVPHPQVRWEFNIKSMGTGHLFYVFL
ncbi:hypothetical protein RHMOL_Rhmol10G0226700 [Rhododendron molle]|uniref:Uncharacterized protein n=1 Tax=Rhododendron molle TaxID=49168 RepID=A0ACC0M599_RHOML|nr:hypothetical protein RHMOL_Rhmol10G0226700 [Rhododendron molle]